MSPELQSLFQPIIDFGNSRIPHWVHYIVESFGWIWVCSWWLRFFRWIANPDKDQI